MAVVGAQGWNGTLGTLTAAKSPAGAGHSASGTVVPLLVDVRGGTPSPPRLALASAE